MVNVLFTSAGRRVELLRAFQDAYKRLGLVGKVLAADMDPLAPALQVADAHYIVPRLTKTEYIPTIAEICRREDVRLIFPLVDPDISALAKHREELEATGARVMAVPEAAVATTADKWKTHALFEELGIPAPVAWLPEDAREASMQFPVFIKPRFGSAARDTFMVRDQRELDFFLDYIEDPIVEEYLPGPEITTDVICGLKGKVLAVISRERIEVRSGEVAKGRTVYDPDIAAYSITIAEALQAIGPITVQCILKDGQPRFTEVNCRYGGGAPLGIAAGVDSPRWFLAQAAGLPLEVPPIGSYIRGLYLSRFDNSIFMPEEQHASTASHRI